MSKLALIIKREFIAKVRNKSFIVMTFLSPLLFVGMGVLIGYLASMNKDSVTKIAIYDEVGYLKNDFKSDKFTQYTDLSLMPFEVAKDTASKSYAGLLFIPKVDSIQQLKEKVEYISEDSPSIEFISDVETVIDSALTTDNLKKLGFDAGKIESAKVNSSLKLSKFSGGESLKGLNEIKVAIGGIMGYLIMMFIIIYGNFVMRSVIEEKTNRIIEIIISSVKPFQLMMGKIIGNSLAGILQFLIWVVVGLVLMFVAQNFFGLQMGSGAVNPESVQIAQQSADFSKLQLYITEIMNLPLGLMISCFIIYFIGGYFLYSSLYAAIGAAVDSETDSQQFLLPIIMPLMLGVYIGFFTVINDPHGTVATVFSIIPFTSPIVMLMRIPFLEPEHYWQLILSIVLLFATFTLVVWFASKIYRVGILMYGKKPTWAELFKWLKY
ncbi:ABC transporter permease [Flavobacterium haoranii]|uniref:ABC-2 type transport system permease protein n=1 Tax=Flavobacterium haoranii TaxID=683124 RepID=A0A1M6IJC8_9FLAO|nr:ABC transporter permease [Flavobacterium haoranii]SHJ34525.1 ABC-2 type transport system permease protein [Flavobacterium haoranii]